MFDNLSTEVKYSIYRKIFMRILIQVKEFVFRYQNKLHQIQSKRTDSGTQVSSQPEDVGVLCCSFQEYLDCSMTAGIE